jgi:hypothetical protein
MAFVYYSEQHTGREGKERKEENKNIKKPMCESRQLTSLLIRSQL